MTAATIGIDLGATHLRAALVDHRGTVSGLVRRALPADIPSRRCAVSTVADELLAEHRHQVIDGMGEIGHLPLDQQGPLCRCGINGCWEQLAAGLALDAAAVAVTGRPGAAALAEAAARGDQVAISVIRSHAELFARGLDGLCAVLAPQLLILGGGIIARSGPVATAYLAAASKLRWHQGETRTAALGDDAGLIGAALAVQQELTNPG